LIDAWVATVLDALAEEKSKVDPLDHKVALALLPEYLEALASLEAEVAVLGSTIKTVSGRDEGEEDDDSDGALLTDAEIKKLKSKLTATRRQLKVAKEAFTQRLAAASDALGADEARFLVLGAFRADVMRQADNRVTRHRQEIISAFETWWDKYKVTLMDLESDRDEAATKLAGFLKELGYE
jgi:type I restriction enzyme M protein